jgi:hypothetical protein
MNRKNALRSVVLMTLCTLAAAGHLEAASGTAVRISTGDGTQVWCWTEPPIVKHPNGTLKTCDLETRALLPLGKNPTLEMWWFPPGKRLDVYADGAVEAGFLEAYSTFRVNPSNSTNPGPFTLKFVQGTQLVFTPKGYAYWGTLASNILDLYTARREPINGMAAIQVTRLSDQGTGYAERGGLYKDTDLSPATIGGNGKIPCLGYDSATGIYQRMRVFPSGDLEFCTLKAARTLNFADSSRRTCQAGFPVTFDAGGRVITCTL